MAGLKPVTLTPRPLLTVGSIVSGYSAWASTEPGTASDTWPPSKVGIPRYRALPCASFTTSSSMTTEPPPARWTRMAG